MRLTKGDDPAEMRAEAMRSANPAAHQAFYDRVALPGWAGRTDRSVVRGRVDRPRGAVAVLSDNRLDFQRTALGYAYWTDVHPDGRFEIGGVRPGTYRLTVFALASGTTWSATTWWCRPAAWSGSTTCPAARRRPAG